MAQPKGKITGAGPGRVYVAVDQMESARGLLRRTDQALGEVLQMARDQRDQVVAAEQKADGTIPDARARARAEIRDMGLAIGNAEKLLADIRKALA